MPSPTSWSRTVPAPATSSPLILGLLTGERWASGVISYSFPEYGSYWATSWGTGYGATNGGQEPFSPYFSPLSSSDRPYFALALGKWSAVANLSFQQVADTASFVGDIRAAYSYSAATAGATAWAYFPGETPKAGDIWFSSTGTAATDVWTLGSFANLTVIHELGHALGLKHPFDGPVPVPAGWDTRSFTVMSYSARAGDPASRFDMEPTTPMLLDILAIQHLYGANMSHQAGASTYVYGDAVRYHETLWDAGGNDTLRYDGWQSASINLTAGQGSTIGQRVHAVSGNGSWQVVHNVWIAYGVAIENAVGGSGNDDLRGNALDNLLSGRGGDDVIDGGEGIDTAVYSGVLTGYSLQRIGASVRFTGPDGSDTLTSVERLVVGGTRLAIDVDGHGGQAYRLYQAAFDRTPDAAGLGYQMSALDAGLALRDVAANFIASPEFGRTYGALDDRAFVNQLYVNVLHRAADAGGLAYHTGRLAAGASRADVLVGFSESPENQAAVIGSIQYGMVYTL
jgi:serralysin